MKFVDDDDDDDLVTEGRWEIPSIISVSKYTNTESPHGYTHSIWIFNGLWYL